MAKFTVGTFEFPSKKALKDHLHARLHAYNEGDRVNPDDQALLSALVELHDDPERKKGGGIDHWVVLSNTRIGVPGRGFWIMQVGNPEPEKFGYGNVIDKPSLRSKVSNALTNAGRVVTDQFREDAFAAGPVNCYQSGEQILSAKEAHARHIDPPLRDLVDDFLQSRGGLGAIVLEPSTTYPGDWPSDPAIVDAWRAHQQVNFGGLRIVKAPRG